MGKYYYKLTDICDFQGGSQPPKNQWINHYKDGYIRMLQIRDFTQNRVDEEFVKITNTIKICSKEDILIARYGASIGKILTGLKGAYNVAIMKSIPNENILYKKYLYYYFNTQYFQYNIKNVGSRAAQAGFNKSELENMQIYVPSLETQKKIVEVLDKAEKLINKRKEQIEALDELVKSRFIDMFGNPKDNKFISKTLKDIVSNDKNSLKRGPFGGALKKDDFVQEGYLVYEQRHAIHNDFEYEKYYISKEKYEDMIMFKVESHDLLVSCSGVTLGRISEVPKNAKSGIINQALLKITLNKEIMNNTYFIYLFRNRQIQDTLFRFSRGSGIPNFPSMNEIKSIKFLCPPIELQNEFAEFVQQIEKIKLEMENSLKELEDNFNSLMQKAFKGELFN